MNIDEPEQPDQATPPVDPSASASQPEGERPPLESAPAFEPTESASALRKLAPPPKPSIARMPAVSAEASPTPAAPAPVPFSAPALRSPMIVVGGEPSAPVAPGAAQAWTRPSPSEPPPSSPVASPAPPRVQPGADLRAKLGIPKLRDSNRPAASEQRVSPPPPAPSSPAPAPPLAAPLPAIAPNPSPPLPAYALPVEPPAPLSQNSLPTSSPSPPLPSFVDPEPATPLQMRVSGIPGEARGSADVDLPLPAYALHDVPAPQAPPAPKAAAPAGASAKPPPPPARAHDSGKMKAAQPVQPESPPLIASSGNLHVEPPTSPIAAPTPVTNEPAAVSAEDTDGERLRSELAAALSGELTPLSPGVEVRRFATPRPEAPPAAAAQDAATPPPRGKSEPARLRGGPPRPRASTPEFIALRSDSDKPHAETNELPGPPRVPNFPLAAGVPARPAPPRRSDPPVTASAIAVMKIVAVGDPSAPATTERDDSSNAEDADADATNAAEAHATKPKTAEDFEELPEEELALVPEPQSTREAEPDSVEVPLEGLEPEQPISIPPTEIVTEATEAAPAAAPTARDGEQPKPPPPPTRNKPKTPSLPKPVPRAKRRAKPPWWEDVFGEDFVRATFRVGDHQIRKEVDFIEESLGVASGGVVLDLGCGAGHHAVELASRGYGVVGYDLSLYQLTLAADVAQERGQKLNFLQGDMREMAFEEMFDGIFCWNTTFGYFEEEKNQYVAERVFQALRPGGMFLLDVVNRDYVAASSPCQLWYEGDACVCMDDMDLDFITSRMNVKRSVILDDGRTREVTYSVRVYSLHELGKMLHDVGFRVTEASGHPSTPGVFFGEHSPRIIILAQKP